MIALLIDGVNSKILVSLNKTSTKGEEDWKVKERKREIF